MKDTGVWDLSEAKKEHVNEPVLSNILINYFNDKPGPIIDMGCGKGYYLNEMKKVWPDRELIGLEGTPNIEEISYFKPIKQQDLTERFNLSIKGNVISLEVMEHIPNNLEENYLLNLIDHTEGYLILSCGIPDQKGYGHVNCQSNKSVIDKIKRLSRESLNPMDYLVATTLEWRVLLKDCSSWWFKSSIMIFKTK